MPARQLVLRIEVHGNLKQPLTMKGKRALATLLSLGVCLLYSQISLTHRESVVIDGAPVKETIALHPESTVLDDIRSIEHIPEEASIRITLKQGARCTHPSLMGRLSGPALFSIHWKPPMETTDGVLLSGNYVSPINGTFFLEIIVIHCDSRIFCGNNSIATECMEDATRHRLTADGSNITVARNENAWNLADGFWIDESYKESRDRPLYTRVQHFADPPRQAAPKNAWVYMHTRRMQSRYTFRWKERIEVLHQSNLTRVCFLGDSHSRISVLATNETLGITGASHNVEALHLLVEYVTDFLKESSDMEAALKQCDRIVMAIGQWDFSHQHGRAPVSFDEYEESIDQTLKKLHQLVPNVPILGRNIHFNGLGKKYIKCPPWDWRSPTSIREMTRIVRNAFASHGEQFSFVDTNFIVEPMWDGAEDWSHLETPARAAETLYLLLEALKLPSDQV